MGNFAYLCPRTGLTAAGNAPTLPHKPGGDVAEPAFFGGISFSGAREPLANVWSVVGREQAGRLHLLHVCPHAFRADLLSHVAGEWRPRVEAGPGASILWGVPFPLGLPAAAADAVAAGGPPATWAAVLAWVADRPADEVRDHFPELHRIARRTDASGNPSPLDVRQYKQTVEGMHWLAALREESRVSVLPQAPAPEAVTTLVEVNPAATMKDLGIRCRRVPSRPGEVRARPAALRPFFSFADPLLELLVVTLDSVWDAAFAGLTAYLAHRDLDQARRTSRDSLQTVELEGWVYRVPAAVPSP